MATIFYVKSVVNNGVDLETTIHKNAFIRSADANKFILNCLSDMYDEHFINRPEDFDNLDDFYLLSTYVGIYTENRIIHTAYYTIEELQIDLD